MPQRNSSLSKSSYELTPHNTFPSVNVPLCFIRVNRWHFKFRLSCAHDRIMTQWGERGRKRRVSIIYGGLGLIVEAWMRRMDACLSGWERRMCVLVLGVCLCLPLKNEAWLQRTSIPLENGKLCLSVLKTMREIWVRSLSALKWAKAFVFAAHSLSPLGFLYLFLFTALVNQLLNCFIWYEAKWLLNLPNTII